MIIGIGANVYDTLITVADMPREDTKMRADYVKISGGGPCATGLCAAARLGAKAMYLGNLSKDLVGDFLLGDMKKYGVDTSFVNRTDGTAFTSYILLNKINASRTCVFDKGTLPPLELSDIQKTAVGKADILLVDGNDIKAAIEAAKLAKEKNIKVLYDAGGLYDGIEDLLLNTDILIPSAEFALAHTKADSTESAAKLLYEKYSAEVVVITDGKRGGLMYDGNEIWNYPAFLIDAVDTNGSGDVFHGAFAFAAEMGYNYKKCCIFSSAVSALKCTSVGARESVPMFDDVKKFLKERGYNEL